MADALHVWLGAAEVGTLTRTRNGARFQYSADVVATGRGRPILSTSLPVRPEPFGPVETAAWFTGLLPEDRQREEIERRFGLQGSTYFDMLRKGAAPRRRREHPHPQATTARSLSRPGDR